MQALSRTQLDGQLAALERSLPRLVAKHKDPADFWPAFAGAADVIEDAAGEHCAYVRERIDAMLSKAAIART